MTRVLLALILIVALSGISDDMVTPKLRVLYWSGGELDSLIHQPCDGYDVFICHNGNWPTDGIYCDSINYGDALYLALKEDWHWTRRSFIMFDTLVTDYDSLEVCEVWLYKTGTATDANWIQAYLVTSFWDEMTVTWETAPSVDLTIASNRFTPIHSDWEGWFALDIDTLYRHWVAGPNFGLQLRQQDLDSNDGQEMFSSDTCPREPEFFATIDSVWFWEETDCDDSNMVHICYILSGDSADIEISISPDSGGMWVPVGTSFFATLFDTLGDYGEDIAAGMHCFDWVMSMDMPDTESWTWLVEVAMEALLDTFEVVDSFGLGSRPQYGVGLGYGDGYYWSYDNSTGQVYYASYCPSFTLCPPVDSVFVGINYNCDFEYDDSVLYYCTNRGVTSIDDTIRRYDLRTGLEEDIYVFPVTMDIEGVAIIGDTLYASQCAMATSMYWYLFGFDISGGFPVTEYDTVISELHSDCTTLEGLAYANGYLWGSNNNGKIVQIDLSTRSIIGCYPVPNVGMGAEGLCWDGEYLWYQNNATRNIYQINIFDSTASEIIVSGPLDSRRPDVELTTPVEPLMPGDTCLFSWTVDDLFWVDDLCEIQIFGCDIDESYSVDGISFLWPIHIFPCPECTVVVSVRDSFCNWSSDTAVVSIAQSSRYVEFPWMTVNRCDTVLVPLHIDSLHHTWLDSAFMRFQADPNVFVPFDLYTVGTFTESWTITRLETFPDLGIIEAECGGATVHGDTGGVFIYVKAYIPCNTFGGSFTDISVDTMFFNNGFPMLSWKDGFIAVELQPQSFFCDLRFNRTVGPSAEDFTLTFGANPSGTEYYNPGLDIIHVPPPVSFVDAWFPIADPDFPVINKLMRDVKLSEPPRYWTIVTGGEPNGIVKWNISRLPEGDFRMNDVIDMKRDSSTTFESGDTLVIEWTIPPLEIIESSFMPQWNMVSSPVIPNGMPPESVFPTTMGVFRYDTPRSSYDYAVYISAGEGYWIWVDDTLERPMAGTIVDRYNTRLFRGWNLIGALGDRAVPVSEIAITPAGARIGDILGYNGVDYHTADSLIPGKAYWVLMNSDGIIIVPPE
ncbi:MAG: DNRLRE domain-containing protein [bacterium]